MDVTRFDLTYGLISREIEGKESKEMSKEDRGRDAYRPLSSFDILSGSRIEVKLPEGGLTCQLRGDSPFDRSAA